MKRDTSNMTDEQIELFNLTDGLKAGINALVDAYGMTADYWHTDNEYATPAELARDRADMSRNAKSALAAFAGAEVYMRKIAKDAGLLADTGEFYFQVWDDAQAHRISMAEEFFKGLRHVAKSETVEVQEA